MTEQMSVLALAAGLGAGVWLLMRVPWNAPRRGGRSRREERIANLLAEAGAGAISARTFRLCCACLAALAGLGALALTGVPAIAAVAAVATAVAPYRVLVGRRQRRRRAFRTAWPEAVDLLVGGIRAGESLSAALTGLAERGPQVLRPYVGTFESRYRVDGDFDGGLGRLAASLADPVADRVCATLGLARRTGGRDVSTVLRGLAASLRAELAVRREVEARQAWTVLAARVSAAAPWAVVALLALRPDGLAPFRSAGGATVLAVGSAMTLAGYRLMLAIGALPEDERT